jgi:hypothetical protein
MEIQQAIRCLQQAKKRGARNVILAFWEADMFGRVDGEAWASACEHVDSQMDWSRTHDDIASVIEEVKQKEV